MSNSYDPSTDSLYIHLADRASVDSVELTDGLVVDYDLDGVAVNPPKLSQSGNDQQCF